MLFETFFCPKCKKNTTLFLSKPKEQISTKPLVITQSSIAAISQPAVAVVEKEIPVVSENQFRRDSHLKIHHALLFLIGFISALLIMKK